MRKRRRLQRLTYRIVLLILTGTLPILANYFPNQKLFAHSAPIPDPQGQVEVGSARRSDTSPRLPDIPRPAVSLGPGRQVKPVRLNPNRTASLALKKDGALQASFGAPHSSSVRKNFDGIGQGFSGPQGSFIIQSAPPDTTGAVGDTQFVQWVNSSFAVFKKTTGAVVFGPVAGNTLWQGLGGGTPVPCEINNDGDPVVQYDKAAKRWVLSQFSVSGGTFAQCVAVSETSDATGRYHRYEFEQPAFNDYPKMGVWSDGYYVSYNMFEGLSGARACAYDRSKMLVGDATATQQCFQLSSSFFGLLPSDLDGKTAPPAGRPNLFVGIGVAPNTLSVWKFHVDWANSANSTFGVGTNHLANATINVAVFTQACNGSGETCVPQLGTTQQLDSLGERLMFRLAYRNFGDHEALVLNHSVDTGPPNIRTGVRWYELRDLSGTPVVFQQGTYAPDLNHRWMGSIAMDRKGDIVAGYSVSGSVHPGVRITSRFPTDPKGILGTERVIRDGTGSQGSATDALSRWGDYSGLTIDPNNDCTFWYTAEYAAANGSEINPTFKWHTRIASFKLRRCRP
jgi:hypothetical protein